jgi:cobalt-zinc-cadmium efflux system outer membrane protein
MRRGVFHHLARTVSQAFEVRWSKGAVFAALLVTAGAVPAPAQPAGGALSLADAIARALEREPALAAARSDAAAMRGLLAQAQLHPNPMVTASRQQEPGGMDNQTSVMLEWPLDLFRKDGRVNVAEHELEAAGHRLSDRERILIADVRRAYGAAAAVRRNRDLAAELASAIERQHALLDARVAAGAAPPLERDLLAVEARRSEADRLLQAADADRALFELKRLLGVDPREPLTLADPLERLASSESLVPRIADEAVATRSDVREARANVRASEARVDRARREGRFDMSIFGSYMRMDAGFPQFGLTVRGALTPIRDVFHYAAAGTTITVPLLNRRQGEVAAAQAQQTSAAALLTAAELQARTDIAAATGDDERARAALAVYASDLRTLAGQNLEVVRQTYALGRGTVNDVILEERRYLDFERGYTATLLRVFEARTALLRAIGERP